MADPTPPPQTGTTGAGTLQISEELKATFGDLIDLIVASESMNDEERQYWLNILPVMTPDQVENLHGILTNEKQQLAAIDAKYSKEIEKVGQEEFLRQVGEERQKRQSERTQAESADKSAEEKSAEQLLKKIEGA